MIELILAVTGGAAPAPTPPPSLPESLAAPSALQDDPEGEEEGEPKGWTGSVTVGGTYTFGNSENRTGNVTADAELRREDDRFSLGFLWVYIETRNKDRDDDGNKDPEYGEWNLTDRKTQGFGQYDYFFAEKTYGYAKAFLQNDYQADLDLRQTYTLGVGQQFIEEENLNLNGEVGVSYVDEDFKIDDDDNDFVAARLAYNVGWKPTESWELAQAVEAFPSLEDSDNIYVRGDTRLKASFGESMFGQLQWLYFWDSTPAQYKERVDQQFLLGIGWKI
jgi:putative salt-induced outer membrane protein YdiY